MSYLTKDSLSIKSRKILANILAEVVLLSDSIEVYRQALASIDFFDCIALFRFLDKQEKGYLREKDLQRAMGTSHKKLLAYVFSWFDTMKVGEISRLEFSAFLLPKQNLELRELVARRVESFEVGAGQSQTILEQFEIFSLMLVEMMKREKTIIELRRQLIGAEDYSKQGLLAAIDINGHEWICGSDIFNFLKNYGFDVGFRQVQKLMESICNNFEGSIKVEQLSWLVEGFESNKKQYLSKIKNSNNKMLKSESSKKKEKNMEPIVGQFTFQGVESEIKDQYLLLLQKFQISKEQERRMDEMLKIEQMKINQSIDRECQQLIQELRNKQKFKSHQLFERRRMDKQIEELRVLREIEEQNLKKSSHHPTFNKYLMKQQENHRYNINYSPVRKDYTNLTDLSRLTQVESYRRPTERSFSNEFYKYPLSRDIQNNHFIKANELKEIIKKQREIQKQIQSRFQSEKYDIEKYSSRRTKKETEMSPYPTYSKWQTQKEQLSTQTKNI